MRARCAAYLFCSVRKSLCSGRVENGEHVLAIVLQTSPFAAPDTYGSALSLTLLAGGCVAVTS